MKKALIILFSIIFLTSSIPITYAAYAQMPEFLCELGLDFYRQGKYGEALHEFKKALLAEPNYQPALRYIQMIEQMEVIEEEVPGVVLPKFKPTGPARIETAEEYLDLIEIQNEMVKERQLVKPTEITVMPKEKKAYPPTVIRLDESLGQIPQPINIEQGKNIIIIGKNIQRFLVTEPKVLTAQKKNADELLLTGKGFGYTYLHIWDGNGRWTMEFLGIFPKPEGLTYEELRRREEEKAGNFKLRYTLDWSSYESGRRIDSLERSSYTWSHGLNLTGPTPYGNIDSAVRMRKLKKTADLTYFTLGLTEGKFWNFKGFGLRTFEYSPPFGNLAFGGATLRGLLFTSPAFNNKLDYATFWGREGGGRYGNLSPGLVKSKNSFLEGSNLNYSPTQKQNYKFTVVHGHGRDREDYLNRYGYDLSSSWLLGKWGLAYEIAQDSENIASLMSVRYSQKRLKFSVELRDIDKDFLNIGGRGWRQGQLGSTLRVNYAPTEKLSMNSNLDVYRDRVYPAEDDNDRWNQNLDWNTNYQLDPKTSLRLSHTFRNNLGGLSQSRYQSSGLGISKKFKFIRDISSYANYYHQENKNFSSPRSDYINDRAYAGLRFSLIGKLYYYLNKEFNWTMERFTGNYSRPDALETGVGWAGQFGKSPLYGSFRFSFRDEEDAGSGLSFMVGEDYIEGYTELSYRPTDDIEIYGSCRTRNVWADSLTVLKRLEMNFNAGMRYLWNTGFRWDSVGDIEGYVFRDLNSDGLRQREEAPVEGVKVWLGKDKSQVTDVFGYFRFKKVKARKAYVNLDTSTIPAGFVLTVPVTQEVSLSHRQTVRLYFGIISRSEIRGYVFEDVDGNGDYNRGDAGVQGVVLTLENGKKAVTDMAGRYSFSNTPTGEHTVTVDLNSLPVYYLPKVSLTKKITLFEGVTYIYNIPLKRIKE